MTTPISLRLAILPPILFTLLATGSDAQAGKPVEFTVRMLALDANEGIAAGDIDGDGVTDLVAGRQWYKGGDWAARPLRNIDGNHAGAGVGGVNGTFFRIGSQESAGQCASAIGRQPSICNLF